MLTAILTTAALALGWLLARGHYTRKLNQQTDKARRVLLAGLERENVR